ncbi:MAG TPA: hypothetical protein VIR16_11885 [Candidatus Limnocylindrales bacterium]
MRRRAAIASIAAGAVLALGVARHASPSNGARPEVAAGVFL